MKLWQKIFLGAFIASVAIFFFCGFYIVVTGLHFTLEGEMKRTEYYQSVYARKIKSFSGNQMRRAGCQGSWMVSGKNWRVREGIFRSGRGRSFDMTVLRSFLRHRAILSWRDRQHIRLRI